MKIKRPKAVVFDMDGLMLDSETIFYWAWKQAIADLGYHLDHALYLNLVGRSNQEVELLLAEQYGDRFPLAEFRQRWPLYWQQRIQTNGIPKKPGLERLLDWFESLNLPKAVGTSSNWEEAQLSLQAAGIFDRFSHIVTVDQAGRGKPAPDIFLMAAQRLEVSPQDCLVLEDSNAGVIAATTAGMQVIMVPDLQIPSEQAIVLSACILPSLNEVHDLLSKTWF